jgi:hypothetical protein
MLIQDIRYTFNFYCRTTRKDGIAGATSEWRFMIKILIKTGEDDNRAYTAEEAFTEESRRFT